MFFSKLYITANKKTYLCLKNIFIKETAFQIWPGDVSHIDGPLQEFFKDFQQDSVDENYIVSVHEDL